MTKSTTTNAVHIHTTTFVTCSNSKVFPQRTLGA